MLSLTRKLLEQNGDRVLDAKNGNAALTLLQSHDGSIDLLLADLVMQGMSGTGTGHKSNHFPSCHPYCLHVRLQRRTQRTA